MKKLLLISAATLIVSNSTFAGGILTNTNQHAAFLRMLSRGATTEKLDVDLYWLKYLLRKLNLKRLVSLH